MAGKKKITQELIEEATVQELKDMAKRLGVDDQIDSKMLKDEIYNLVLTEFLSQQESEETETPEEDGKEDAAPQVTAAEAYRKLQAQRRGEVAEEEEPEPEEEEEKEEKPKVLTYHILKGKNETQIQGQRSLRRMKRQLGIKRHEMEVLERNARSDGQASLLKIRRIKGRSAKIFFIVRYS
jgi:hypothetical protein